MADDFMSKGYEMLAAAGFPVAWPEGDQRPAVTHVYGEVVIGANPILAAGQGVREAATGRVKVGDGVSLWNDLPYVD